MLANLSTLVYCDIESSIDKVIEKCDRKNMEL